MHEGPMAARLWADPSCVEIDGRGSVFSRSHLQDKLECIMFRILTIRLPLLAATFVLPFTSLAAQYGSTFSRVEITPFGSYHWGGSIGTDAFSTIPAGTIQEEASFSWGAIASFAASPNSAVEILYLRQDTDVKFKQALGNTRNLGGFA